MEVWSTYIRLTIVGAAVSAAVMPLGGPGAVADSPATLYERCPAEPPAVIGAGGIGESLGRRDSYVVVELDRVLTHPAEYYARRIRFRTPATNRTLCLHWACALGSGRGRIYYGGP